MLVLKETFGGVIIAPTALISLLPARRSLVLSPPWAHPAINTIIIEIKVDPPKKMFPTFAWVPSKAMPGAKSGQAMARAKTTVFSNSAFDDPNTMNASFWKINESVSTHHKIPFVHQTKRS